MTQTNNNLEVTADTKANAEALVPRFKLTRVLNQGMPTEDHMLVVKHFFTDTNKKIKPVVASLSTDLSMTNPPS